MSEGGREGGREGEGGMQRGGGRNGGGREEWRGEGGREERKSVRREKNGRMEEELEGKWREVGKNKIGSWKWD